MSLRAWVGVLGVPALTLAVLVAASGPDEGTNREVGSRTGPARAQVAGDVEALLDAVRGLRPLSCALAQRTVGGRWGPGRSLTVVDAPGAPDPDAERAAGAWMGRALAAGERGRLLDALAEPDACVRVVAALVLGGEREPSAVPALVERARSAAAEPALAALRALGAGGWSEAGPGVRGLLDHPDARRRAGAAWALGGIEDTAAEADLAERLSDPDRVVRRNAAWALGRLERASAVPRLVEALRDGEPTVRINVAWALGQIESASAIPALTELLATDDSPAVREAAAWALGQIE